MFYGKISSFSGKSLKGQSQKVQQAVLEVILLLYLCFVLIVSRLLVFFLLLTSIMTEISVWRV